MHRTTHGIVQGALARPSSHTVLAVALVAGVMLTRGTRAVHAQSDPVIKPIRTGTAVDTTSSGTTASTGARPQNLKATIWRRVNTVGSWRGLTLSWTGTDGLTGCALGRASSRYGPFATVANGCTVDPLRGSDEAPGTGGTSYYQVTVTYGNGTWGVSDPLRVDFPTGPQGITGLTASSPTQGTAVLRWTADPEAIGYRIERSKQGEPYIKIVDSPPLTQPTFTDTGLWNGAKYVYVVHAVYAVPNTSADAYVTVTIAP